MARRTSVIQVMVTGDAKDLNRATREGSQGLGLLGGAAVAASKLVASSMTAIAGFSIREFAKFDDAMTKSTAIMGDLSDAMRKDMEIAAREVAKTTSFAASEAADAFFFLASAGLDAQQSIAALPKVAAFAQAGQFDLARATDLLTDAQSALGLSSDDAAENMENMVRVSDVLAKANTIANASIEEFSQALTEKAGVAMQQLGVDIEEGAAALAIFADQGTKGTKAGTLLNTTLEGLTRTADENSDAYERLGVSVFDNEGEMRNLADIIGDLEGAFDGMSTQARNAELRNLGFTRQARDGVLQLLGNSEALREYERELRNAAGTTEEIAEKQLQSFNAQLGLLMSGFADIGIAIGTALAGPLSRFVSWFQEQLPAIEAFVERAIPRFEAFVDGAVSKFREFKSVYDENLAEPLGNLLERLGDLAGDGLNFVMAFRERAVNFLLDFATAVSEADSEEAGALLGFAISDLVELAFDQFVDFGKILAKWAGEQDWVAIGATMSVHMAQFAKGMFIGLTHSLDEESGEFEYDGSKVMRLIAAGLILRIPVFRNSLRAGTGIFRISILRWLGRAIVGLTAPVFKIFGFLGRILAAGIGMAFGGTKTLGVITSAMTGLRLLFTGQFGTFFRALWPKITSVFARLAQAIVGAISRWGPMILRGLGRIGLSIIRFIGTTLLRIVAPAILKFVGGFIGSILAAVVSIPGILVGAFIALITTFVRRFRRWNEENGDEYESFGERIVEFIKQGFDNMRTWFRENVIQWFKDRFDAIGDWFSRSWDTFKSWGSSIVTGMVQGIKDNASAIGDALRSAASNGWERTKSFLRIGSPSKLFAEVGEAIGDGLTLGIDDSSVGVLRSLSGLSADLAATDFRAPTVPVTGAQAGQTVINVQVTSADPTAVVEAIRRYTRANGPLGAVVNV